MSVSVFDNFNYTQLKYQKQKKETIDSYRGFQTMDSKDHPVVQQGKKAAEITSEVNILFVLVYVICNTSSLLFNQTFTDPLQRGLGSRKAISLLPSAYHTWL